MKNITQEPNTEPNYVVETIFPQETPSENSLIQNITNISNPDIDECVIRFVIGEKQ